MATTICACEHAVATGLLKEDVAFKALLAKRIDAFDGQMSAKGTGEILDDELAQTVAGITPDSLHSEIDAGPDICRKLDRWK